MSGASEALLRKIDGARDLSSVVRSMKALAASSVGQYERAVESLRDYTQTVNFALSRCVRELAEAPAAARARPTAAGLVLFGSDQGLVGRFNDTLMEFVHQQISILPTRIGRLWTVGDRMEQLAADSTLPHPTGTPAAYSVEAITALADELLLAIEDARAAGSVDAIYLAHNSPLAGGSYKPTLTRLLPLDAQWQASLAMQWPSKAIPQVIDGATSALPALIRSYLFIALFQVYAQSLAGENASRLAAMQRAEENIATLLAGLTGQFHRLRQASIDEELFEVVSGYEALTPGVPVADCGKSVAPRGHSGKYRLGTRLP